MIRLVIENIEATVFGMDDGVAFWAVSLEIVEEELPEIGLSMKQAGVRRTQAVVGIAPATMDKGHDGEKVNGSNSGKKRA